MDSIGLSLGSAIPGNLKILNSFNFNIYSKPAVFSVGKPFIIAICSLSSANWGMRVWQLQNTTFFISPNEGSVAIYACHYNASSVTGIGSISSSLPNSSITVNAADSSYLSGCIVAYG